VLEADVRDRRTSGEIDALDPIRGVYSNVRHTSVCDVLAVAEGETAKLGTSHNCTRWQRRWHWLTVCATFTLRTCSTTVHLSLVLCMRQCHLGWQFGDYPSNNTRKQIVTDFPAVAEINLLQAFRFLYHF
jgi:hypothetical protein